MKRSDDIRMRDPFVLARPAEGRYYLFGTTDADPWRGPGTGFDVYIGTDLESWDGPFPAFRPEPDFWGKENFWAPEVHEYGGAFYMFASFKAEGRRRATQILKAEGPEGPYSPHSPGPVTPAEWECLDGTLYVDGEGIPWIVFCHEWVQTVDGEICALPLSRDLTKPEGKPRLLFRGSEASWTQAHRRKDGSTDPRSRVTDGPFLHRPAGGGLLLLWSSFTGSGYALGIAKSESGILGPWVQEESPVIDSDGGHGMVFRGLDGRLYLAFHSPNDTPNERFRCIPAEETKTGLIRAYGR